MIKVITGATLIAATLAELGYGRRWAALCGAVANSGRLQPPPAKLQFREGKESFLAIRIRAIDGQESTFMLSAPATTAGRDELEAAGDAIIRGCGRADGIARLLAAIA